MNKYLICIALLVGINTTANAEKIYKIKPKGEVLISIPSSVGKIVGFKVEHSSKNKIAARKCPIKKINTIDIKLCAGIFDANDLSENGPYIESDIGASMLFHPSNGIINVILRNYAPSNMTYVVTIEDYN